MNMQSNVTQGGPRIGDKEASIGVAEYRRNRSRRAPEAHPPFLFFFERGSKLLHQQVVNQDRVSDLLLLCHKLSPRETIPTQQKPRHRRSQAIALFSPISHLLSGKPPQSPTKLLGAKPSSAVLPKKRCISTKSFSSMSKEQDC